MTTEPKDLVAEISVSCGMPPDKCMALVEMIFENLHRRMYEYEGGNGDFLREVLSFELSDKAWIHLHELLLLHRLRHSRANAEDEICDSVTALEYMGGQDRWRKYFVQMRGWKISKHFGLDRPLYD